MRAAVARPAQPCQPEAQERAALALGDGVQLVQDDGPKAGEVGAGILVGEQESQRLGRREQDVGRMAAHPGAAVLRRVARARRVRDGQRHLGQRRLEVAADVGREGLERRDVERVQPLTTAAPAQLDEARQEARERLAAARGRYQQRVSALSRHLEHARLMLSELPPTPGEPVIEYRRQRGRQMTLQAAHRRIAPKRHSLVDRIGQIDTPRRLTRRRWP